MRIRRIVIACLSSQYIHVPLAPLCLKKALTEAAPEVNVLIPEMNINEPHDLLLEKIALLDPDLVAFSVYIWNREESARLCQVLKSLFPGLPTVIGGPEVTYDVEDAFRAFTCDYLLRGAGEESFPRLVRALMEDAPLDGIPGLCTLAGGRSDVATSPAPRSDLYDSAFLERLHGRMVYAETSRGCPFRCAFCLSGRAEAMQQMPGQEALDLLIRLGQSGSPIVKLVDRTFNWDRKRTFFLLKGIMDAKNLGLLPEVCYHMEVAADLFDDATLSLIAQAPPGLFQFEAGVQSFHVPTLKACRRVTDMFLLVDRLTRLIASGRVHVHMDLIAGLPEEDLKTFGCSFDQAFALRPHQLQLGILKLIPGSHFRQTQWGQVFSPYPPYDVLRTPWITYEELCLLRDCAEAVERVWNTGRFRETVETILSGGVRPFDLFIALSRKLKREQVKPAKVAEVLFAEGQAFGLSEDSLRSSLLLDWLSFDSTGTLPLFLREKAMVPQDRLRPWKAAHPLSARPRVACCPDGGILLALWEKKDPVTQRGEVERLP